MKNIGRDTTVYQLQVQTRPGMILKIVLLFLRSDGLVMSHQAFLHPCLTLNVQQGIRYAH